MIPVSARWWVWWIALAVTAAAVERWRHATVVACGRIRGALETIRLGRRLLAVPDRCWGMTEWLNPMRIQCEIVEVRDLKRWVSWLVMMMVMA